MHKGKPVIVGKRPPWRHPIFPWGWYSISQDSFDLKDGDEIVADGAYDPDDGWGSTFVFEETGPLPKSTMEGVEIDQRHDMGKMFRYRESTDSWVSEDGDEIITNLEDKCMKAEEHMRRIVNTYGYQKDKPILKKDLDLLKKKIENEHTQALKEEVEGLHKEAKLAKELSHEKSEYYRLEKRSEEAYWRVLNLITNLENNEQE